MRLHTHSWNCWFQQLRKNTSKCTQKHPLKFTFFPKKSEGNDAADLDQQCVLADLYQRLNHVLYLKWLASQKPWAKTPCLDPLPSERSLKNPLFKMTFKLFLSCLHLSLLQLWTVDLTELLSLTNVPASTVYHCLYLCLLSSIASKKICSHSINSEGAHIFYSFIYLF